MENIIEKIKEEITTALLDENIVVDNVEYVYENNYYFLKVTLDKEGGIDLDTIVDASNIINPVVEKLDLIDNEYILDVSSKERGK